ncbi:MAG TPA: hypothetical protein VOA80_04700 [Thermoanaerobaculia bacterium]|nr:hypothetical protein [Thermoanaerobaculia bacterium]
MSATIGMHFPGNHVNTQYFNVGYSFEEVDLRGVAELRYTS